MLFGVEWLDEFWVIMSQYLVSKVYGLVIKVDFLFDGMLMFKDIRI